jgi:hypothetical protein
MPKSFPIYKRIANRKKPTVVELRGTLSRLQTSYVLLAGGKRDWRDYFTPNQRALILDFLPSNRTLIGPSNYSGPVRARNTSDIATLRIVERNIRRYLQTQRSNHYA